MIGQGRMVASDAVLASEVGGEIVILDVQSGAYFTLDATGSHVWRALAEPADLPTLCRKLERRYDAPPETIRRDVSAFLEKMLDKGLVRILD